MMDRHWLKIAAEVLKSETSDLRRLMLIAGGKPDSFYRNVDLSDADLRGQDLRDFNFDGALLRDVAIDERTRLAKRYRERIGRDSSRNPDALASSGIRNGNDKKLWLDEIGKIVDYALDLLIAGDVEGAIREIEYYSDLNKEYNIVAIILKKQRKVKNYILLEFLSILFGTDMNNYEVSLSYMRALIGAESYSEAMSVASYMKKYYPGDNQAALGEIKILLKLGQFESCHELVMTLVKSGSLKLSDIYRVNSILIEFSRFRTLFDATLAGLERHPGSGRLIRVLVWLSNYIKVDQETIRSAFINGLNSNENKAFLNTILKHSDDSSFNSTLGPIILSEDVLARCPQLSVVVVSWMIDERRYDSAEEIARLWVEAEQSEASLRLLADVLIKRGDGKRAVHLLQEYVDRKPSAVAAKWLADAFLEIGDIVSAIALLESTVARYPEQVGPHKWLIQALVAGGRIPDARALWASVVGTDKQPGKKTLRLVESGD